MRDHHYLGFRGMIGNSPRHVAERSDGAWVALLGWRAGAHKLAAPGQVDRLDGGAAVAAAAFDREQRSIRDFAGLFGAEPGVAGVGPKPAAAVGRHARGARASGAAGGRRSWIRRCSRGPATGRPTGRRWGCRRATSGYRAGATGSTAGRRRSSSGSCRGTPARCCAVGRTIRRGAARRRRRRRRRSSRFGCAACTTICAGCRTSGRAADGATSWRRCWRSPWRPSCAARRGWRRRPSSRSV